MSDDDISRLISEVASDPMSGVEIKGTGGCRKLRFAADSKERGKSGGLRVITFFSGGKMPVFLLTVFAKNQKVDLTGTEKNHLRKMTEMIKYEYSIRRQ